MQMPVADFVERLKLFKASNVQRDKVYLRLICRVVLDVYFKNIFKQMLALSFQDILACVVKNLFEEYRFFHEYPERELRTTAEVYGSIIREGVISYVSFSYSLAIRCVIDVFRLLYFFNLIWSSSAVMLWFLIFCHNSAKIMGISFRKLQFATAVRKVIESLQADPGTMLWTFGIVALNACRSKLSAYPKVCVMIAKQRNFQHFPQTLKVISALRIFASFVAFVHFKKAIRRSHLVHTIGSESN